MRPQCPVRAFFTSLTQLNWNRRLTPVAHPYTPLLLWYMIQKTGSLSVFVKAGLKTICELEPALHPQPTKLSQSH